MKIDFDVDIHKRSLKNSRNISSTEEVIEEIFNYLLSFQEHNAFHETCIEEIYHQFESHFLLQNLIVIGKFMRRGGISINPIRSFKPISKSMIFHEQYQ